MTARAFDSEDEGAWPQRSPTRTSARCVWSPPKEFVLPLDSSRGAADAGDAAVDSLSGGPSLRARRPKVVLGLHRRDRGARALRGDSDHPDATLEAAAVLDPDSLRDGDAGPDERRSWALRFDDFEATGASVEGRCLLLSRADFENTRGVLERDAVVVRVGKG